MRAGHFTLIEHAGIKFEDLDIMYMAGASGTYVDAVKAREVGLLPPLCNTIYQIGNTSLSMATDILRDPELLDELQDIANRIRSNHIMFATDKTRTFTKEVKTYSFPTHSIRTHLKTH